jgi:uncharacterized protein
MEEISTAGNPTTARERVPALDVLRGFALFGILLINIEDFSGPNGFGLRTVWDDAPDRAAVWLLKFAAEAKFRAVFAFLFGLGFALQLRRGDDDHRAFVARYVRRLAVLLAIGVAHFLLLWEADVLTSYALVGFLLLPFARSPVRQTLIASGVLAALAVAALSVIVLLATPRPGGPAAVPQEKVETADVYGHGSYREVVSYRVRQAGSYFGRIVPTAPFTLMLFLLGLAAGKAGLVFDPAGHRALLSRLFLGGLLFGVVANGIVTFYSPRLMSLPKLGRLPVVASYVLGSPVLGLAYLAGLTLLLLDPAWQARLRPLAAPGRMALTNYLMQSVICTTLFYGYGLGWYNRVSPLAGVGLCLTIFVAQAVLSAWWLLRFRYGPAEWLWRSLTYLRPLPMLGGAETGGPPRGGEDLVPRDGLGH